jgi:hypothetical protein
LPEKDIKEATIKCFNNHFKTYFKIENNSKEVKVIKKNQMEIRELKN